MGFFKKLFGTNSSPEVEETKHDADYEIVRFDGIKAIKAGRFDHAERCFLYVLEHDDSDLEAHDYLSQTYIHLGKLDEAYAQLRILANAEPDNAQIWMRMANVGYMDEKYEQMLSDAQRALQLTPDDAVCHYLVAMAQNGLGNSEAAIDELSTAISQHENYGDARLLRAQIYLKENNLDAAASDAAVLYEHVPESEDVLLLNARLAHAKGDDAGAFDFYQKTIDVNPFCRDAYKERAALYEATGNAEKANEDRQMLSEIDGSENNENIEQKIKERQKDSLVNPFGL